MIEVYQKFEARSSLSGVSSLIAILNVLKQPGLSII